MCAGYSQSARFSIPFEFTVGNKLLPSGTYAVARVSHSNDSFWRVTDAQGKSVAFMTNSVWPQTDENGCSLLFRRVEGEYSLVQLCPNGNYGHEVIGPKGSRPVIAKAGVVEIAAQR
jgi:hypothetical protein